MTRRIPRHGYPSSTQAVVSLRAQGLTVRQTAETLGIAETAVTSLEHYARRRGKREPRKRVGRPWTASFPEATLDALMPHARARDITPAELARRLVSTALDHDLIDAILDDGEGT